jgi:hypothetical protein
MFWNPEMLSLPIVGLFLRSVVCMNNATSSTPDSSPFVLFTPLPPQTLFTRLESGKEYPAPEVAGQDW